MNIVSRAARDAMNQTKTTTGHRANPGTTVHRQQPPNNDLPDNEPNAVPEDISSAPDGNLNRLTLGGY